MGVILATEKIAILRVGVVSIIYRRRKKRDPAPRGMEWERGAERK